MPFYEYQAYCPGLFPAESGYICGKRIVRRLASGNYSTPNLSTNSLKKEMFMSGIASSALPAVVSGPRWLVDGSGWQGVYKILKKDGYRVNIVQNPTLTLEDDVAVTRRANRFSRGPNNSRRSLLRWCGNH